MAGLLFASKPTEFAKVNNQTKIETNDHIETANIAFQAVTIAMVALYTLTETVQFIASAVA
jgi:hypothetical protein